MFIVTQERDNVLNVDNVISVNVDGKRIVAVTKTNDYVIGAYTDPDRAEGVFKEMLQNVFQPVIVMKNCKPDENFEKFENLLGTSKVCLVENVGDRASVEFINNETYYMPEK